MTNLFVILSEAKDIVCNKKIQLCAGFCFFVICKFVPAPRSELMSERGTLFFLLVVCCGYFLVPVSSSPTPPAPGTI